MSNTTRTPILLALIALTLLVPLGASAQSTTSVRELVPASAPAGARLFVTGRGLADPAITVAFTAASGTVNAEVLQRNERYVEVIVPPNAYSGNVRVSLGATKIADKAFTLADNPKYKVVTIAGGKSSGNNPLKHPQGAAVILPDGRIAVADEQHHSIKVFTPAGAETVLAGTGKQGFKDGVGTAAEFKDPRGITYDAQRKLLIVSDSGNHAIRSVALDGTVKTIAGSGKAGDLDLTGAQATFNDPRGLTVGVDGAIYVADSKNHKIRRVTAAGAVTTYAGTGKSGSSITNGTRAQATFNAPRGIVAQGSVLWIADTKNNAIRKIEGDSVTTVMSFPRTGDSDDPDDSGNGDPKTLNRPSGIGVDDGGNLIVADSENDFVRAIIMRTTPPTLITLAGTGKNGWVDGDGNVAQFKDPLQLVVAGAIYLADEDNDALRALCPEVKVTGLVVPNGKLVAGTDVRLFGTGFVPGATTVKFADVAATDVTWISSTSLAVKIPQAITGGSVSIVVSACGGTTAATSFVVDNTPPVLEITNGGVPLADNALFKVPVIPVLKAIDEFDPSPAVTATLNGNPFTSGTTISADGIYTLIANAEDAAGNRVSQTVRFTIDATPPVVQVLEGINPQTPFPTGGVFNRPVVIDLKITDLTKPEHSAAIDNNPYTLKTPFTGDGLHRFTATVKDALLNETKVGPIEFTIDTKPPALTFTSHTDGQVVTTRNVVIKGGTDDAQTVKVNGVSATVDLTAKTFTSAEVSLIEGENTVTAVGVDKATNSGSATLKLILDTRAPDVVITSPASNACVRDSNLEIRGTVADPNTAKVVVKLDGVSTDATLDAAKRNWSATIALGGEGKKTIVVEATDAAGHVSTRELALSVDRQDPVIELTESGAPFTASIVGRAVTIYFRATDADDTPTVSANLNGAAFTSGGTVSQERSHTITVVAADCAGNSTSRAHTFVIDLTPPRFLSFSPASGSKVAQIPNALSGTTDGDAIEVRVVGRNVRVPVTNGSFTLANLGFTDGINELTLEVEDRAGHTARTSYTVGVRTQKPLVEIIENGQAIADNAVFNRAVEPRIRVFEDGVTYSATLDGAPFNSGTVVSTSGAHTIVATATDTAYGHTNSVTRHFTIDRSAPSVTITSPADGATIDSDRVNVNVAAPDAVSVSVNGTAAMKNADGSWTAANVALEVGENALSAIGRDSAGNTGHDTNIVNRGGAGPAIILTFPPDGFLTNRPRIDVAGRVLRPSSVSVTVPPAGATSVAADPAGSFRMTGAQLKEGTTTITAIATDSSGKASTVTSRVIADFTPPLVRLLESGQAFGESAQFGAQAVITGDATDAGKSIAFELLIDGNEVTSPHTVSTAGGHTAVITARDEAGNESRLERTFYVGSVAGGGCKLEGFDPANGSIITAQKVELIGRTGGAAGVKVNGIAAKVYSGSFCATVELPQEGANSVTIQCTDAAGAPTGTPVTITLVRVTNEPSVTITTPVEDYVTADEVLTVTGTVGNGAVSVDVNGAPATINGSNWTAANVRLSDGVNILVAHAKSAGGRTATASRRVTFIDDPPSITISAPIAGFVTGTNRVDLTGTWINVDPQSLAVTGLAGAVTPYPWSDTTGRFIAKDIPLTSGENTITITGRDRIGRTASASLVVKYLTTSPAINITSPADNHYFPASQGDTFRVSGSFVAAEGSTVDVNGVVATVDQEAKSFFADVPFSTLANAATPVVARLAQPGGGEGAFDTVRVFKLGAVPKVLEIFPPANSVEVDPGVVALVLFSAPMDGESVKQAFRLESSTGAQVTGKPYLDKDVLTFAPATTLTPGEHYTIRIATTAKDLAGQQIASEVTSGFTIATTAPASGPVLTTASGRFCGQLIDVAGTTTPSARVRIDYGAIFFSTTASSTGAFSYKVPLSGQAGYHIIRVRTVGADGTMSPFTELKLNVDCSGPRVLTAAYDRLVNKLTITFSRDVKASTITTGASGSVQLVLSDSRVAGGTTAITGPSVVLTPTDDLTKATFTLRVTTAVEDTQSRKLEFPHTQLFQFGDDAPQTGDGRGFITGEVYDATTGRPLANAEIVVEAPGSSVTMITDARGRYGDRFAEGAHTIRASATGYTSVFRQIIVPAGAGVIPIDIRLTRKGETHTVASGALTISHGVNNAITRRAELTIPAGAATTGAKLTLTSTGAQSLAGLLPLGWSPLASAVIASDAKDLPGAKLTFDVPESEIVAASQSLTAVRYDESRDEWRVLVPVVNILTNKASFDIAAPGAYALVYADRRAGLAAPPSPGAGSPLLGAADRCADGTCPPMAAKSFPLDPEIVLPTGSTVATLNIAGDGTHVYPSGTAVQAYIDEELRLADGGRELDPPFATDLLLYRDLAGNIGVATFNLAPSARAAEVFLEVGFDHIRILPYPGRLDRGTLIGPEGGRVPGDDKITIDIPTGATPEALRATASSLTDPASFGPINGFTIVGGFQLTLQRVGNTTPTDIDGDGDVDTLVPLELTTPARATLTVPQSANVTPQSQLILAEVLDQTPYGHAIIRLAAEMTALDATRWTSKTIDRERLPVDGVLHEGRYLLLAANAPIAFAKGIVRASAGGIALADARVTTPSLGVADLSRLTGIFNVPVPATPAAPFKLVPRTLAVGDGKTYDHASAPASNEVVNVGDLVVAAQPPVVESTLPSANASEVSVGTNVQVTFSKDIDPASAIITVGNVAGRVEVSGRVVTWKLPAGAFLEPNTRYTVTVSPMTRAKNGAALGSAYVFSFTTITKITNTEVRPEKIRITIPDGGGNSRIIGDAGALPAGWVAVPVRRVRDFAANYSATAASDGSFSMTVAGVSIEDDIDLRVVNNNGALSAIIPLTPFVSEDGRGFIAPVSDTDVRFTSSQGISVIVPAGAFDKPTLIRVDESTKAPFAAVPNFDQELRFGTAVRLDFDGVAKKRLQLELPVPAGWQPQPGKDVMLGWLGQSIRGPRVMIVDTVRVDGSKFTTADAPNATSAARFTPESNAVLTGREVKAHLLGVLRAGVYTTVDLIIPLPSGFALMPIFQAAIDIFMSEWQSLYAADFYLFEGRGRIAIPVVAGKPFKIEGVDSATGFKVFEKSYANADNGVIEDPNPDTIGPYPVFAEPVRVEQVDLNDDETLVRNFRLEFTPPSPPTTTIGYVAITSNPNEPASMRLPEGVKVQALNTRTGQATDSVTVPSDGYFNLGTLQALRGDRIILIAGVKDENSDAALSVVFNEPIDTGDLKTNILLDAYTNTGKIELTNHLVYTVDSNGRRIHFDLPSDQLIRDARYEITLKGTIKDLAGNKLANGLKDLVLSFHTRPVQGAIGEFEIEPSPVHKDGAVRDMATYGNILFVSALDGGLLAYDASDPTKLKSNYPTCSPAPCTPAPPSHPKPLAFVPGRWQDSAGTGITMGFDQHWAVATDRHGRVYSTGFMSNLGVVRGYRVSDFLAAPSTPMCTQFSGAPANANCKYYGSAITGWRTGYTSSLPLSVGTATVLSDRVEAIPRKMQLLVQDDEETFKTLADLKAAYPHSIVQSWPAGALEPDFQKLDVKLDYVPNSAQPHYLTQRITVENVTRKMRWSADFSAGAPAKFIEGVIAHRGDELKIHRNLHTYAVISQFGHGVGMFDLNAIESNDVSPRPAGFKPLREQIIATRADFDASCSPMQPLPAGITDLAFSAESAVIPTPDASSIIAFAPDTHKGVLGIGVDVSEAIDDAGTTAECVYRDYGFVPYDRAANTIHPRLQPILTRYIADNRRLNSRFQSVSHYRGELKGEPVDYLLISGNDLGMLMLQVGPPAMPYTSDPLQLAGQVWVPDGVVAVRHIPGSHMATLVDRTGRVMIVDLTRVDERLDADGNITSGMFATAAKAFNDPSAPAGQYGVDDPRIIWKSEAGLVKNTMAPIVDPATGILIAGDVLEKGMRAVPAIDPRIRMIINAGDGVRREVAGATPLGFEPRADLLVKADDANASAAAFRFEVTLPAGAAKALDSIGRGLQLAVESEFMPGYDVAQTPVNLPKAHLREKLRTDPPNNADPRATKFELKRDLPSELENEIWFQEGASRYVSPWIVAIGDPRASEKWKWNDDAVILPTYNDAQVKLASDERAKQGCPSCVRPKALRFKSEAEGVYELWTGGRFIAVRPDWTVASNIFLNTPYEYLGKDKRLEARFTAVPARKVRPTEVLVAAHNPPVADGMLQETHYVHSGEIETATTDLNAGGRAGVDVVVSRTYRSRTIGGTSIGEGWDAPMYRFLLQRPSGDVEYHDGAGEIWVFDFDSSTGKYVSPAGLFLKLTRSARGFTMLDQQWRIAEFNEYGQLTSESDEFYDPATPDSGNRIRYSYDERGQLLRITDPVGRVTELKYWGHDAAIVSCPSGYPMSASAGLNAPCGYPGRLREVNAKWRKRTVQYLYDDVGRLTRVNLPEFKAGANVPGTYSHTGSNRPAIEYAYEAVSEPSPNEPAASQVYTNFAEFFGNLTSITDPSQTAKGLSAVPRVRFAYDLSTTEGKRDRNTTQTWGTGESATFSPHPSGYVDVLGQRRTYVLTGADQYDKRIHIFKKQVYDVPVMEAAASVLPDTITAVLNPSSRPQIETTYVYNEHGQEDLVTMPNGLVIDNTWGTPAGAPGTILESTVETAPGGMKIETDYGFDNTEYATANVRRVGRRYGTSANYSYRDSGTPSRSRLNVENSVDGTSTGAKFTKNGQLDGTSSSEGGTVAMSSKIDYYLESTTNPIESGRVMRVQRGGGVISFFTTYAVMPPGDPAGEEVETTTDEILQTKTIITRDIDGRTTSKTAIDAANVVVNAEFFGYDAEGRLAYHRRPQQGVGDVVTTFSYDAAGRQTGTEMTGARVNDQPKTVKMLTEYKLPQRQIIEYDSHTGNESSAIRTVTTLDRLGRAEKTERTDPSGTLRSTMTAAWDIHGQLAYQSDRKRMAALTQHDAFGRPIKTILTDGTRTETDYNEWDEVVATRGFEKKTGTTLVLSSQSVNRYTENGRLRLRAEQIDSAGRARGIGHSWHNADSITTQRVGAIAMGDLEIPDTAKVRVAQTQRDSAGRVLNESIGESKGHEAILDAEDDPAAVFAQRRITKYKSEQLKEEVAAEPRVGRMSRMEFDYDGAGRPNMVREAGTYVSTTTYDEAGNPRISTAAGLGGVTAHFDARGLEWKRDLPGASTKRIYDELGNLRQYVDELGQTTTFNVDGLGRVHEIVYPDLTTEETVFENGTGVVLARRDRAKQWIWFKYDDNGGRLLEEHLAGVGNEPDEPTSSSTAIRRYSYDDAGRLTRIATRDAAIEFADFDLLGRPRLTRNIRYKKTGCIPSATPCGTGLTTGEIAEVYTQGHVWNVFDERDRWRMPFAGDSLPASESDNAWRNWIVETRDGIGNVTAQHEATSATSSLGELIAEATARGTGRLIARKRPVSTTNVVTEFSYADEDDPEMSSAPIAAPAAASGAPNGSLGRAVSKSGTNVVAGSQITRDDGRRIETAVDVALTTHTSSFDYDNRGRLTDTTLLGYETPGAPTADADPAVNASSLVTGREAAPRIDSLEFNKLGLAGKLVEPLSWTATQIDPGYQIRRRKFEHGSTAQGEESFTYKGGRRITHGDWTLTYDPTGRLVVAENDGALRRIAYDYDPFDRIVGRTAYTKDENGAWILETRTNVLARDGLPASATFVWDPVVDRLVAVFDSATQSVLRQYVHGDQSLDDPIEALIAAAPNATPQRFLPIVDTAATGSLHATLDGEGRLVERVLYADAYGDAPRYLHGAVVERAHVTVNGSTRTLRIHLSEAVDATTLSGAVRLTAIANKSALRDATPTVTLEGDRTLVVSIDPALLTDADSLEIGVASSLRFIGWGNRPMQSVAQWEKTLEIAGSTAAHPFLRTVSLSLLDGDVYTLPDLYLAGRTESLAKLNFAFHALPFHEPASGFTFVRARWYDAATASFLTPDPMGYVDASALYAYAGSDPINFRDPTGMEAEDDEEEEEEEEDGWFKKLRLAASIGAGMVPVLGEALDAAQVVTGYDFIAGEKLSAAERAITAAALVIPGVGGAAMRKTLGAAGDLVKHSDEAAAIAKNADEVASAAAKNTDEFTAAAAHHADDIGTNASSAVKRADGAADDGMGSLQRGGGGANAPPSALDPPSSRAASPAGGAVPPSSIASTGIPTPPRRSNRDLIQEIATRSERWGVRKGYGAAGTGAAQGTRKHDHAAKMLRRYQRMEEHATGFRRGLEAESSWIAHGRAMPGTPGSTRLDVYDPSSGVVYDYKFVKNPGRGLRPKQRRHILNQGPLGITGIVEINP